jgi:hypothetical protein
MPSTLIVVFGAGCSEMFTGTPPTEIDVTIASPVEPAHVVCDVDWTRPILITGRPSTPIVASWTDAVAVDAPGLTLVVTLAHNVCALIRPPIVSTHGGATVVAAAVATEPVSGTGDIDTRPLAFRPYARPVMNNSFSVADADAGW